MSVRDLWWSSTFFILFFLQFKKNVPLCNVLSHPAIRGFANNSKLGRIRCRGWNAKLIKIDLNFQKVWNPNQIKFYVDSDNKYLINMKEITEHSMVDFFFKPKALFVYWCLKQLCRTEWKLCWIQFYPLLFFSDLFTL